MPLISVNLKEASEEERTKVVKLLEAAIVKCEGASEARKEVLRCAISDLMLAVKEIAVAHHLSALEAVFVGAVAWDDILETAEHRIEASISKKIPESNTLSNEQVRLAGIAIASDIGGNA